MTEPTAATAAEPTVDEAIAHVEDQLSFVFGRARAVWKEAAQQIHPELNPAGYKLLATVVRLGSTNAHVLTELFDMDKSVVSRQIRMLEEVGLVESRPDERDGRVRVLAPTPLAVERITAVRARNQSRLHAVLRERSVAELELFAEMLGGLAEA
ncbi:MarR family winged helix-turn-helix transcriptional regulator [Agromyces sp. NPDC057679]|uniref:MarR family winged helix-turn-helix transcriptional regulator n=1 Tax=Agromyces sp. NPDC057679 TaxID=3346207 RepID=UPI003671BEC1